MHLAFEGYLGGFQGTFGRGIFGVYWRYMQVYAAGYIQVYLGGVIFGVYWRYMQEGEGILYLEYIWEGILGGIFEKGGDIWRGEWEYIWEGIFGGIFGSGYIQGICNPEDPFCGKVLFVFGWVYLGCMSIFGMGIFLHFISFYTRLFPQISTVSIPNVMPNCVYFGSVSSGYAS